MAELLVTGGTGVLGREAVPALRAAGHTVRVLSREPGDGHVVGDLSDPAAMPRLAPALDGVETVLHLASSPRREVWETDVAGTRRLAVAARAAGVGHLLLVSVPGADDVPFSYNHAKFAAEEIVAAAGVPYTIVRASQFHPFVSTLISLLHRAPVLPVGRGWRLQPVDTGDVADHLVGLVAAGPAGRIVEFGGPEVRDAADLARSWLAARGGGRVLTLPVPGGFSRAVRAGGMLAAADAPRGKVTWEEWLARTGGETPYPI
jgi:uncharacterized protein YbjT (DUF2867 family)